MGAEQSERGQLGQCSVFPSVALRLPSFVHKHNAIHTIFLSHFLYSLEEESKCGKCPVQGKVLYSRHCFLLQIFCTDYILFLLSRIKKQLYKNYL